MAVGSSIAVRAASLLVATGTGTTAGAATTTLLTFVIPDGRATNYEVHWAAIDLANNVGATYGRAFGVFRSGATARFLAGTPTPIMTGEDEAAATVVLSVVGTNLVFQGTGVAARNYDWTVKLYEKVRQ